MANVLQVKAQRLEGTEQERERTEGERPKFRKNVPGVTLTYMRSLHCHRRINETGPRDAHGRLLPQTKDLMLQRCAGGSLK